MSQRASCAQMGAFNRSRLLDGRQRLRVEANPTISAYLELQEPN
jgi:hypothetical protein